MTIGDDGDNGDVGDNSDVGDIGDVGDVGDNSDVKRKTGVSSSGLLLEEVCFNLQS